MLNLEPTELLEKCSTIIANIISVDQYDEIDCIEILMNNLINR